MNEEEEHGDEKRHHQLRPPPCWRRRHVYHHAVQVGAARPALLLVPRFAFVRGLLSYSYPVLRS